MPKSKPGHKLTFDVRILCELTQAFVAASGGVEDDEGKREVESYELVATLEKIIRQGLEPYKSIEISNLQVRVS